jgi:hypothetical protein
MLNAPQSISIPRQQLYEQVWSQPMTRLARQYGISDVALAKICRKLSIPYPGRGYWRRKQTGKVVKQFPLPPSADPAKQSATISKQAAQSEIILPAKEKLISTQGEQKIEVPDRLVSPHKLLSRQLTQLRSPKVDRWAMWSGDSGTSTRVSPRSPAISGFWSAFAALESRGYQLTLEGGTQSSYVSASRGTDSVRPQDSFEKYIGSAQRPPTGMASGRYACVPTERC